MGPGSGKPEGSRQQCRGILSMVWYKNLYLGELIRRRAEDTRREIDAGKYPANVYLVVLPENVHSELEIISAQRLRIPYVRTHIPMAVGLAFGQEEAVIVARNIVQDTVDHTGGADVRSYLLRGE